MSRAYLVKCVQWFVIVYGVYLDAAVCLAQLWDSKGQRHLCNLLTTMRPWGIEGKQREVKKEAGREKRREYNAEGKKKEADSELE